MRPHRRTHDVEVRVVDGVDLLGRGGNNAEGLRVDDLMTAVGGLADLAHADATVHTGHAHTRAGRNGAIGPVLGQRGGRGV